MRFHVFFLILSLQVGVLFTVFGCGGGGSVREVVNVFSGTQDTGSGGNDPGGSTNTTNTPQKVLYYSTRTSGDGPGIYMFTSDDGSSTQLYATSTQMNVMRIYDNDTKVMLNANVNSILSIDISSKQVDTLFDNSGNPGCGYYEPAVSPNGNTMIYKEYCSTTDRFMKCNIDGSNSTEFLDHSSFAVYPTYSPDGSKVLFTSSGGHHVVSSGGGAASLLLSNTVYASADYSPDGSKIAYLYGQKMIKIANADGTNEQTIHTSATADLGFMIRYYDNDTLFFQKIAQESPTTIYHLYKINTDGTGLTALVTDGTNFF